MKRKLSVFAGMLLLAYNLVAQPQAAGQPREVIVMEQVCMSPQWSPDGRYIAFTSLNYNGIWLFDQQKQAITLLTDDAGVGFGFAWSPDGKSILARPVIYENLRRFHQVKMYDANTRQQFLLQDKTRALEGFPMWTLGGSQVAMVLDGQLQLKNTGKPAVKTSDVPVVYALNGNLYQADHQRKSASRLSVFEGRHIFNIAVSPQGDKIAFQVSGLGLFVINSDGTSLTHLGNGERASWMPDGGYVIVTLIEDDGKVITSGELYAVDIKSGEYFHLTAHTSLVAIKPTVSPDGKQVAFDDPHIGRIYVMDLK